MLKMSNICNTCSLNSIKYYIPKPVQVDVRLLLFFSCSAYICLTSTDILHSQDNLQFMRLLAEVVYVQLVAIATGQVVPVVSDDCLFVRRGFIAASFQKYLTRPFCLAAIIS